jgi:hypothetical protein
VEVKAVSEVSYIGRGDERPRRKMRRRLADWYSELAAGGEIRREERGIGGLRAYPPQGGLTWTQGDRGARALAGIPSRRKRRRPTGG